MQWAAVQFGGQRQNVSENLSGNYDFGDLERELVTMAAISQILIQLFSQRRHRPIHDGFWRH